MKTVDFISKHNGTRFNCVYRLVSNDRGVVYVGSSSFPSDRIRSHMYSDRKFDYVEYDEYPDFCEMLHNEAVQIVKFNPVYNIDLPSSDDFYKLKEAQDFINRELKSLVDDLPCVFSRGRSRYVSKSDLNKLKDEILKSAIECLDGMRT